MEGSSLEWLGNDEELSGGKKLDSDADNWSLVVKEYPRSNMSLSEPPGSRSMAGGGREVAVDGGWLMEEEAVGDGALPDDVAGGSSSNMLLHH
jgi:hypothetical protein